jgi:four helix bundle protein
VDSRHPVNFTELQCWNCSHSLAIECYRLTNQFPSYERHALGAQLRRSASSVSANIAEGFGRGTVRDYVRLLYIARGSLLETESHLLLARDVGHLRPDDIGRVLRLRGDAGRLFYGLITSLRRRKVKGAPEACSAGHEEVGRRRGGDWA